MLRISNNITIQNPQPAGSLSIPDCSSGELFWRERVRVRVTTRPTTNGSDRRRNPIPSQPPEYEQSIQTRARRVEYPFPRGQQREKQERKHDVDRYMRAAMSLAGCPPSPRCPIEKGGKGRIHTTDKARSENAAIGIPAPSVHPFRSVPSVVGHQSVQSSQNKSIPATNQPKNKKVPAGFPSVRRHIRNVYGIIVCQKKMNRKSQANPGGKKMSLRSRLFVAEFGVVVVVGVGKSRK
ncbi:hypothetical protein QBC39DRAFT_20139 [Podospora conica]|nr:hypothetical protein QBC39DRAFT_20139 [Schizothecium conicum]